MNNINLDKLIKSSFEDHNKSLSYVLSKDFEVVFEESMKIIWNTLNKGGCIFTCGNGGSFSDAQHFTAELVVRYNRDRQALSSITLGCNSSNLTACANDYKYEDIFKREYQALSKNEDTLILISTSGNSKNIQNILKYAISENRKWILLTSNNLKEKPKEGIVIDFPFTTTAAVQECHIFYLQLICRAIDYLLIGDQ